MLFICTFSFFFVFFSFLMNFSNHELFVFLFSVYIYYLRWYIFEETALSIWTGILYISYLKVNIARAWYDFHLQNKFYLFIYSNSLAMMESIWGFWCFAKLLLKRTEENSSSIEIRSMLILYVARHTYLLVDFNSCAVFIFLNLTLVAGIIWLSGGRMQSWLCCWLFWQFPWYSCYSYFFFTGICLKFILIIVFLFWYS